MKIYIAALSNVISQISPHGAIIRAAEPKWVLESYHYMNNSKVEEIRETKRKVFLDSGAYSMFTQGVKIDLKTYAKFIHRHHDIIDVVANLDAIGAGQEQVNYDRQKALESEGCMVLPVHHVRDADKWLERYIDEGYGYICLGGMVPETTPYLREWLDHVWHRYLTDKDGRPRVKVHGFGLTATSLMFRYPWFSVDSTAWVMTSQFGGIMLDMPHGDFKIDFSARSKKQMDINSWHYRSLPKPSQRAVDGRLAELEAARVKLPELEEQLESILGYKQGYYPTALAESYGWRAHSNIHYFDRIQERRVDTFKRKQETLFT